MWSDEMKHGKTDIAKKRLWRYFLPCSVIIQLCVSKKYWDRRKSTTFDEKLYARTSSNFFDKTKEM